MPRKPSPPAEKEPVANPPPHPDPGGRAIGFGKLVELGSNALEVLKSLPAGLRAMAVLSVLALLVLGFLHGLAQLGNSDLVFVDGLVGLVILTTCVLSIAEYATNSRKRRYANDEKAIMARLRLEQLAKALRSKSAEVAKLIERPEEELLQALDSCNEHMSL